MMHRGRRAWAAAALLLAACACLGLNLAAPEDLREAVALATLNCLIIGALAFRLWVVSPFRHALELAFLPGIALSWPIPTLYFATFYPQATFENMDGEVLFLMGADRLQWVVLVFLLAYAAALAPLLLKRPERAGAAGPIAIGGGEWGAVLLGLWSIAAPCLASVFGVTGTVDFLARAFRIYFGSFLFVAGFRWQALSVRQRVAVGVGLAVPGLLNTLANARGPALLPVAMAVLGFVFSPHTSARARAVLMGSILAVYPVYLSLANQTRQALQSKGFEDLGTRASTLLDTVSGERAVEYERGGVLSDAMSRHFCAGGQAMVVYGWGRNSIADIDLAEYMSELGNHLLPAFIFGQPKNRKFTGSQGLVAYGFRVDENTSVEVSLLGSLYGQGGMAMVFLGGVLAGLAHLAFSRVFFRREVTGFLLMFMAGCVAVSLWAYNDDLMQMIRVHLWMAVYCGLAYYLIRVGRFIAGHHWRETQPILLTGMRPHIERER